MNRFGQERKDKEARRRLVGYLVFALAVGFILSLLIFVE